MRRVAIVGAGFVAITLLAWAGSFATPDVLDRRLLLALAALVVHLRVYVAAHFASDAIAGAAIGVAMGTLVTLTLGFRSHDPSRDRSRGQPARPLSAR